MNKNCRIFKLPKGNGKFREVYAPCFEYKQALSQRVGDIAMKMENLDKNMINHAFMSKRNCVTNALAHVGHNYTLSMDLTDFFDSVVPKMVRQHLSKDDIELCFVDGVARQGLPTSPAIANIAFYKADMAIIKALKKNKIQSVYTRYADDLTFSFDLLEHAKAIENIVKQAVSRRGFKVNKSKTKLQSAKNGRRIITGVAVGDVGVYPTRKIIKKIRAAQHNGSADSLRGLVEWSLCKVPKYIPVVSDVAVGDIYALSKSWKMGVAKADIETIPVKETMVLDNNCVISGDPVDMLGMSTFTTGWTSCMSKTGQYRKGTGFWMLLKGTRIAYHKSNKLMKVGKITRHKMISRALVHELRNGVLVYDKFYGNNSSTLKDELEKAGVISMSKAKRLYKGKKVVGNVVIKYKPYFDNLCSGTAKRKNTDIKIRYAKI